MSEKEMLDYEKIGAVIGKIMTLLQEGELTNAESVGVLKSCSALAESAIQMEGLAAIMTKSLERP